MRRHFAALFALPLLAVGACASLPIPGRAPSERWAFTAPWDPRSAASLRAHAAALDAAVTEWIQLDTITGMPFSAYEDSAPPLASGIRRMALVTSYVGDRFFPSTVRHLALDPLALARSAAAIAERVSRGGYRGMVLDLEGLTGADSALTRAVVSAVAREAHARGIAPVAVALPASDTVGYPARLFDGSADLLLVMLYDEHWATSPPGSIAQPEWVRRTLGTRVAERGASRVVAALPIYGYLWRTGAPSATISYDDARHLAAEAGVALDRDPATGTLHAVRGGADGWELWVSDAGLVDRLQREAVALGVRRIAYWRMGLEDPVVWNLPRP
jgi:spore germination protein YaaH